MVLGFISFLRTLGAQDLQNGRRGWGLNVQAFCYYSTCPSSLSLTVKTSDCQLVSVSEHFPVCYSVLYKVLLGNIHDGGPLGPCYLWSDKFNTISLQMPLASLWHILNTNPCVLFGEMDNSVNKWSLKKTGSWVELIKNSGYNFRRWFFIWIISKPVPSSWPIADGATGRRNKRETSNSTDPHWVDEKMNSMCPKGSIAYLLIFLYVVSTHFNGSMHAKKDMWQQQLYQWISVL